MVNRRQLYVTIPWVIVTLVVLVGIYEPRPTHVLRELKELRKIVEHLRDEVSEHDALIRENMSKLGTKDE